MDKQNIAVLFGGRSNEHEVSLQSAAAVIDNMDRSRYVPVLVGITREGNWLKFEGDTDRIRQNTWHEHESCLPALLSPCREKGGLVVLHDGEYSLIRIDAAFPVLHGKFGEDGKLQGLLELAGIPYVGCDALSSAICMDKALAHSLVEAAGVKVPRSTVIYKGDTDAEHKISRADLQYPLYVKPAKSGSSIGITKISAPKELEEALGQAYRHDDKVVVEEGVEGFEVGCALLGNESPIAGEVDEIELAGDFFNFHEKYSLATSKIHMPARIDQHTSHKIKETAKHIYKTLGCTGMARVDMFLTPDKQIIFNEVNTIPGFTANSRFPNMLSASGLTYGNIIERLIDLALERGRPV